MFGTMHQRQEAGEGRSTTPVVVYGTDWCAATQMMRRYLDRLRIPYTYRNMDADPLAENQVRWWTGGYASHPTLQIGGDILVEPSIAEVEDELTANGLI